jgi:DtxR family Mn-dependent transcriptional regulator
VVARNITVERLPGATLPGEAAETLADLADGEGGRVLGILVGLQGPQRRRLLDLGFVPGTVVEAELIGASGDPVGYRVRGALIALRKDQARWVQIDRAGGNGVEA